MEISALLHPLNLQSVDQDWVDEVWNKEFLEAVDLPREYELSIEEIDVNNTVLIPFIKATKAWLNFDTDSDSKVDTDSDEKVDRTWRNLSNTIHHREFIAFLFHLIQKAPKNIMSDDCRVSGILAGRTYLSMAIIPGSAVYGIFHSQMYIQCLSCFKFPSLILEQNIYYNDASEMNVLNKQLKILLNDVFLMLYNIDLKNGEESLEETICCLVEFIGNTNIDTRMAIDRSNLLKLSELALKCINILIQGEEGGEPDELVIRLVFKALLPKFTSLTGTKKTMMLWRASGVTYCGILLMSHGAAALPGFTCLLQHLCYNSEGMERSDNRTARVQLVAGLLSLLPLKPYKNLLKWVVKLSRNTKPQLRLFAVELLGTLVGGEDRNFGDAVTDGGATLEPPELPRAPSPEPIPCTSREIAPADPEHAPSDASEDTPAEPEPEPENIMVHTVSQQHQQVTHRDLLRVVRDRCRDVASTVRTRAVAILAACSVSPNLSVRDTIKEVFDGEEGLLELGLHNLEDDKVTVRRTALILVENILSKNQPTSENLQPIVALCRDTSIVVRCAAISCLTRLARVWSNSVTLEAWLTGPLLQLSDPEVKAQDLVVESLKNLLFTPLVSHSLTLTAEDKGPWLLLDATIRKNMRRNLSRGISMLSKSNSKVLSFRLVDTLSTHIGTHNNLSCWVLLSCLARHIQVSDIHFVLNYFNEMTTEAMFNDTRLIILVLEVLREWSKFIPPLEATVLRSRLIRSLSEGSLPSAGARGAVALASRLTVLLGGDARWACDLMAEGERKLLHTPRKEIQGPALLAMADLALAAERRPSVEIIDLLVDIIGSFDDQRDEEQPLNVRACAVAALGKLSIRERKTAEQVAPLCARLLQDLRCPLPLKVNSMCVLADLCTRFTSIVEPMLSSVCACLGSKDTAVRRCAAQLVTHLLVGDFLRLRGTLYFHYFPLICDEDEAVRDIAHYYILNCLVSRNKSILCNNFVECIFYYNGFEGHAKYANFTVSEEEKKMFTLQGEEKRQIRLTIYELMLSHMSDIQRLNTQEKLCKETGTLVELGEDGMEVLRDILFCLRRAAKPPQTRQPSEDMAARVTTNIISQKIKLSVMDKVVPTVLRLHRRLRSCSSPLVPDLVAYASDLLRDYKTEIEDLFDADPELMDEINALQASNTSTPHPGHRSRVDNIPPGFEEDQSSMLDMGDDQIRDTPLRTVAKIKNSKKRGDSRTSKVKRSLVLNVD